MKRIVWFTLALTFTGCLGEEKVWSLKFDSSPVRFELHMIHHSDSIEYGNNERWFSGGGYRLESTDSVLRDDHLSIHVHESGFIEDFAYRLQREFWIDANITFQPDIDFVEGTLQSALWVERDDSRVEESFLFEGVAYPADWCGENPCDF
ncbi:MAG: hypothetical protein ACKV2T_14265 [Kofleriaceae bacterium]